MKKQLPAFKTKVTTTKSFHYENTGVNLNFSLEVDDDKQMSRFLKCLKAAVVDVEALMEK